MKLRGEELLQVGGMDFPARLAAEVIELVLRQSQQSHLLVQ